MGTIGDEFHFILECPKNAALRNILIPKKFRSPLSMFTLCNLFQAGKKYQLNLSKFIKRAKSV